MEIQCIERKLEKAVPQKPPEQVIRPCCYYLRANHFINTYTVSHCVGYE